MELNAVVLSFVLDFLDILRDHSLRQAFRVVSRDFQKSLYDVILRPEAIQWFMQNIFDRYQCHAEWDNPVPEPWFHRVPKTQFGRRRDMPKFDQTRKSCLRRLFIDNLEDTDVFICFLLCMSPLIFFPL